MRPDPQCLLAAAEKRPLPTKGDRAANSLRAKAAHPQLCKRKELPCAVSCVITSPGWEKRRGLSFQIVSLRRYLGWREELRGSGCQAQSCCLAGGSFSPREVGS